MRKTIIHERLSGRIIGAGMTVLNELKPGLDEKLYENALMLELLGLGHRVDQQARYPVRYKGRVVGTLVPDLIVDDLVIVDAKVATSITDDHIAQVLGYLSITELTLGLILNFKHARLDWKRVVRSPGSGS